MLYDVHFSFQKNSGILSFQCDSSNKSINGNRIVLKKFDIKSLQEKMLNYYGIKETILTSANDFVPVNFDSVPSFEGRVLVYEKKSTVLDSRLMGPA